jgi:hypothetical protein
MNVLGDSHVVDGLLAFLEDRRASVGPMPCSRCLLSGRLSVSPRGRADNAFSRRAGHAGISTLDVRTGRLQWGTASAGAGACEGVMTRDGTVGRSDATERSLPLHWDIDPARVMRPRFADSIRASSPSGLREQAGHMTASDFCAARAAFPLARRGPSTHEAAHVHYAAGGAAAGWAAGGGGAIIR